MAQNKPYWFCEECGHIDYKKPMPSDREAFYRIKPDVKCPSCKSIGFHPVGF